MSKTGVAFVLMAGFCSVLAFQNCQSHTTIDQHDLYSSSGTQGQSPSPMPAQAPFMFANKWKPLGATTPPPALFGHSAVYTGDKVIIWGGNNSTTTLLPSGGYILDVAKNSWSAITGGPKARTKHMAVWTGKTMIVWGGQGVSNAAPVPTYNDGGIYDPASGTWTAIAAFGLSPRAGAAAVWTGSLMLVWGGMDGNSNALGDGAMYNPATNSWSPMSATGAPSPRKHPMAIWTGSKMLVWGGANGQSTAFMNDGALFDPATNTWSALTQTSAPSGRQWSSADIAAANSLVFIFGGHNGAALGDGYSLDLTSGAWTATSSTGAPSARYGHSAVMTSQGLVIFGGTNGTSVFGDSYLYY